MKRIIRLTESDLTRIVRRVIMEQNPQAQQQKAMYDSFIKKTGTNGVSGGKEKYTDAKGIEREGIFIEAGNGPSLLIKYNCTTKTDILGYNTTNIKAELDYFCANPKIGSYAI
jgi:hypothetical protein